MQQPNDIIHPVRPDSILSEWGSIEPHLERVLSRIDSGNSLDDVVTKLQRSQLQLWNIANWQAIAITQVTILPRHKTITIVYVSGDYVDEWLPYLAETMHEFAIFEGAKYVEFYGRRGWQKRAKELGYDEAFTVMRQTVDYGQQRQQRHSNYN